MVTRELAVVGELNNAYNDGTRGKFTCSRNLTADTAFGIASSYDSGEDWYIVGEKHIGDRGTVTFPRATRRSAAEVPVRVHQAPGPQQHLREMGHRDPRDIVDRRHELRDPAEAHARPQQRARVRGLRGRRGVPSRADRDRGLQAFDVYLTTRSGFSENVTLDYACGGPLRKKHYLCGRDGVSSAYTSGRVYSGAQR